MEKNKNQRHPGPPAPRGSKPGRQEHTNKGRPDSRTEPSARHDTDHDTGTASGQGIKPVTNQDEQRRATNAGNADDVMGEQETEGDRRLNHISRPYQTSEDFMTFQRKTPTME